MPIRQFTAAVVQHPPHFLNLRATVERACALIEEAAAEGARVIAFPESYVPGYPGWLFDAAKWDDPVAKRLHRQLMSNSLERGSAELADLQAAARDAQAVVVVGGTERDTRFSRGSLYNSLFTIGADGELEPDRV